MYGREDSEKTINVRSRIIIRVGRFCDKYTAYFAIYCTKNKCTTQLHLFFACKSNIFSKDKEYNVGKSKSEWKIEYFSPKLAKSNKRTVRNKERTAGKNS